ncbi:DUF4169 family protein [Denitrobaculum tricleocarpae]|uniref:DUF4169 family protein n=1 Tax=Denitrobaculum tricleocarpae TaxID=2591009 RepID=A0A545T5N5_9PROT|nr:DUF4169 family protein [Denitrobaculum tricleocarpae]
MGDVINLRQERKRRKRNAKEAEASNNRAKFGLTKGEKTKNKLESDRAAQRLDDHRKDDPEA